MTDDLLKELAELPRGARQVVADWCRERIESLRDELESAGTEREINRAQGGLAALRDLLRRLAHRGNA